jgi:hypothetical protein
MKKIVLSLLMLALLVSFVPAAYATEPENTVPETTGPVRAENECGEGITWAFADGVLTIRGDGEMDDFEEGHAPWQAHKDEIEEVIIEGKLTYIGSYAFKDFDNLLAVSFGEDLYEIGTEAFRSCDGLNAIWLPESFKVFGEGSFQSCKNLKEIHCSGRFPSFRQNCLWDTYVTIYFPAEKPWGTEYIQQLEEAFKGRVEFLASDGSDPYEPTEPAPETEAPTEPEETVPETTAPVETEEPTMPILIMPRPTEAPETEPPAETGEQTEPAAEPEEETVPVPEAPEKKGGIHIGIVIVAAVLAGLGLGCLIFGRKKGRYQR